MVPSMSDLIVTPLKKVRAFGEGLPLAWLECRGDEHDWRRLDAYTITDKSDPLFGARFRSKRCINCKGVKKRWVHPRTGATLKTAREYPEGYARKGEGRIDRFGRQELQRLYTQRETAILSAPAPRATRTRTKRQSSAKKAAPAKNTSSRALNAVGPLFREPAA